MSKKKILLIEDDPDLGELVCYNLKRDGYQVSWAKDGVEGLKLAFEDTPDLVLLDIMLPGQDGYEVCRRLKADRQTKQAQVVMLTARTEESDVVSGLEVGADDYITKPFSPRVLGARIKARLREDAPDNDRDKEAVTVGLLHIDPLRHQVRVGKQEVILTPTEFRIVMLLAKSPGVVFSRYEIVDAVQGDNAVVTDRSVDVQIVGLRKKLGACAGYIETVRGFGYRFRERAD